MTCRIAKVQKPLIYLIGILLSGFIVDLSWVIKLHNSIFHLNIDERFILFLIRIAWAFNFIELHCLGLFIESISARNYRIKLHQIFWLIINIFCVGYFIGLACLQFNFSLNGQRPWLEFKLMSITSMYLLPMLVMSAVYFMLQNIRDVNFPKILKKQIIILIKYLLSAFVVCEIMQGFLVGNFGESCLIASISTILLTSAICYTLYKIMDLRFLNFYDHVQSHLKYNFVDTFKSFLEQLSHVSNIQELGHITQTCFKDMFFVTPNQVSFYFRKLQTQLDDNLQLSPIEMLVEHYMNLSNEQYWLLHKGCKEQKILIYDDIAFSNFYEENEQNETMLHFLDQIHADIFLPVYDHQVLIAYIIVERNARVDKLYSNVERDEMLVYASYLGNIINLLQNRNLNHMVQKEKKLREELYQKHQEINQYKESIRSFVCDHKQYVLGILFYKNNRFIFGNKEAKELIGIDINSLAGHPLSKILNQLVDHVQEYKSNLTTYAKDVDGNKLVLSAIIGIGNNIIIMVYYSEIADVIQQQIESLKNPAEWDYLLYLETTKAGRLINQLVPGSGTQLLNFKIELLKMALSKKAIFLNIPDDDVSAVVEVIQHISLREKLHILKLQEPMDNDTIAINLFGINPIFGMQQQALLEKLNNLGTLFIQNIHYLDLESQHLLADYIRYGFYTPYKSDQRIASNVRIICSSNQNLQNLSQEGKFSRQLFYELKQVTLSIPSLLTLPDEEMNQLVQGFSEQAVATTLLKDFLVLSDKEKSKLLQNRPSSLRECKERVLSFLAQKSKKSNISQEVSFDPADSVADPELIEAKKLGKYALKDPKMLAMLWNKFQKNQNQIAAFLGVNRSSVSRRCKDYNLL